MIHRFSGHDTVAHATSPGWKRWTLIIPLLFLIASFSFADTSPRDLFEKGCKAYHDGNYAEALNGWQDLLSRGYRDTRIEFNMGNASFKLGRMGEAILHYERALQLNPKDERIRKNLEFVRLRLKDRFPSKREGVYTRLFSGLYNLFSADDLALILLVLLLILEGLWTLYLVKHEKTTRTVVTFIATFLLALSLLFGSLFGVKLYQRYGVERGVVLTPAVTAKSAPREDATDLFVVHEGATIRLLEKVGAYRRVTLPNGLTGFIPAGTFEKI